MLCSVPTGACGDLFFFCGAHVPPPHSRGDIYIDPLFRNTSTDVKYAEDALYTSVCTHSRKVMASQRRSANKNKFSHGFQHC